VKCGFASGHQVLEPGQMMVRTKDGKSAKAQVELASLIQTCVLLGADFKPLSRSSAIASHSERQNKLIAKAVARQISSGTDLVIPGQSNAPGASNMVAVASAFPNSQVLPSVRASDIGYSSASTVINTTLIGGNPFDGAGMTVRTVNSGAVLTSVRGGSLQFSSVTGNSNYSGAGSSFGLGTVYSSSSVINSVEWSPLR
jgi:hypothetical protein